MSRDLSKGVNDLRDKTVLSFDPGSATAVEVARGDGGRFTLRSADGKWSLEGSDQPVDDERRRRVRRARSAGSTGSQVLGEAPADLGAYGLATPALTITVKGKDDVLIGTVRAGSRSPNPPATEYTRQARRRADGVPAARLPVQAARQAAGGFRRQPRQSP